MDYQVKSKERVSDHGEVFTGDREVVAMLDLVQQETERIDSRFLEPACGTGNFLSEVLKRKLAIVEKRYKKSQTDYERYAVIAVSSIYGVDILEDNVEECRDRLFDIFVQRYSRLFKTDGNKKCLETVRYILSCNIIWGDALTLKTVSDQPEYITFSEWSPIGNSQIKRRDYTFHGLLAHESYRDTPLFSDLGEDVFIPSPENEYPPVHFLEIAYVQK